MTEDERHQARMHEHAHAMARLREQETRERLRKLKLENDRREAALRRERLRHLYVAHDADPMLRRVK